MRGRGAIAFRVMLAVAVGAGGLWGAARLTSDAPTSESSGNAPPNVAGVTAPAPVARSNPPAPAAPAQPTPTATQNDPFAGVDVSNDSVLRHIAGIEEKARARPGSGKRTPVAPSDAAPARPAGEVATTAREDAAADTRRRPTETPTPATSSPSPMVVDQAGPPAAAAGQARPFASIAPMPRENAASTAPVRAATIPAGSQPPPAQDAAPLPSPESSGERKDQPKGPPAARERTLAAARVEAATATPNVTAPLRIVERTLPNFPGEALRAGVRSGRVVARVTIDADGRVTATDVLSATPTGFFERESRRALATWRYAPPGQPTTADVELVFTLD